MALPSPTYLFDPSSRQVPLSQLDADPIPGPEPGEVGPEAIGHVSEDLGPVRELDPEQAVGEGLHHYPVNELTGLGHERQLYLMNARSGQP